MHDDADQHLWETAGEDLFGPDETASDSASSVGAPSRRARRIVKAAIYAAATGLTLVEPRKLTGWRRIGYAAAVSALTGAAAHVGQRESSASFGWFSYAPLTTGVFMPRDTSLALATAGVTFGLKDAWMALDGRIVDALAAAGIRHPRALLAVATAALSGAALALDRGEQQDELTDDVEDVELTELGPKVREVAESILAQAEGWGAPELRAQLAQAKQRGPFAAGYLALDVGDDAVQVPLDYYTFPAYATGIVDGAEVTIMLQIEAGFLDGLWVDALPPHISDVETALSTELTYGVGQPY